MLKCFFGFIFNLYSTFGLLRSAKCESPPLSEGFGCFGRGAFANAFGTMSLASQIAKNVLHNVKGSSLEANVVFFEGCFKDIVRFCRF